MFATISKEMVPPIPDGCVPDREDTPDGKMEVFNDGTKRWRKFKGELISFLEYEKSGKAPNYNRITRLWHAPGW